MKYIQVDTEQFELFSFDRQIIAKLAFFVQEICLISVVKSHSISSEGSQQSGFDPVDVPVLIKEITWRYQESGTRL